MKKLISLTLLALMLLAQPSYSQETIPVPIPKPNLQQKTPEPQNFQQMLLLRTPCSPYSKMKELMDQYEETPLFTATAMTFSAQFGQPYNGGLIFFVNQDKQSYTVLQVFADGMACMLVNGRNFEPYNGE